jgi:3-isopropylmalate/(R)-2-methylmalate dehydratase small subunit
MWSASCHLYNADQIPDGADVKLIINAGYIEADGKRYYIEPVPEFMQGIIRAGGLVEYAKNMKEVPLCTGSQQ